MAFRPTIAVDFDGVLHSYTSGWKGVGVVADDPVPGALEWLARLYECDYFDSAPLRVAIYSSRSKSLRGRRAMKRWLQRQLRVRYGDMAGPGLDPYVDEIMHWLTWPWFKPPAFVTVDDRAVCFMGDWSEITPERLRAFRPWNKQ